MKSVHAKVSESGRLSLPAEFRKELGLQEGGNVVVSLEDRTIHIRTLDEAIRRAQEIARRLSEGRPDMTVDDFIAERRREAQREEEELLRPERGGARSKDDE